MKIIETYSWSRRDFLYDAECEHCKRISKRNTGYDDSNYYNNVLPDIKCQNCKESSNSKLSNLPKTIVLPKYNENQII